jgi:hypothetical protein
MKTQVFQFLIRQWGVDAQSSGYRTKGKHRKCTHAQIVPPNSSIQELSDTLRPPEAAGTVLISTALPQPVGAVGDNRIGTVSSTGAANPFFSAHGNFDPENRIILIYPSSSFWERILDNKVSYPTKRTGKLSAHGVAERNGLLPSIENCAQGPERFILTLSSLRANQAHL